MARGHGAGTSLPGDAGDAAPGQPPSVLDDGYRNTTEFLRARLQIKAAEARNRLRLAGRLLPRPGLAGNVLPPVHEELAAAVAGGEVSACSAGLAVAALDRAGLFCGAEALAGMEHALTRTAAENDPDFLARVAQGWAEALDPDGAEPSEELLRQLQGAFIRKPRHGLRHLEIFATAEQFEHLLTVMNTATNPRAGSAGAFGGSTSGSSGPSGGTPGSSSDGSSGPSGGTPGTAGGSSGPTGGTPGTAGGTAAAFIGDEAPCSVELDLRSRPQKLLDGLVNGCKVALGSGGLPAAGGLRPQVMVTIDYRDLLDRLNSAVPTRPGEAAEFGARPGEAAKFDAGPGGSAGTGTMLFTGPITASTVRKIACDADIIPVLLGGRGRVLDIGRASRIFPPHVRKALIARDQGCAFPGCTIPASWCEAHHIDYWSRGGSTGTENGTLLCSHHHHLIHKEQWAIQMRAGIPWFTPPPHLDPSRRPRRNHFFRPAGSERFSVLAE